MADTKEELWRIGRSIYDQHLRETQHHSRRIAIARYDVDLTQLDGKHINKVWLTGAVTCNNYEEHDYDEDAYKTSKNSLLGVVLTSRGFGPQFYMAPKYSSGRHKGESPRIDFTVNSSAIYAKDGYDVIDLTINEPEWKSPETIPELNALIAEEDKYRQAIEEEQRAAREAALESERLHKEAEEARLRAQQAADLERLLLEEEAKEARLRAEEQKRKEEELRRNAEAMEERRMAELRQRREQQRHASTAPSLPALNIVDPEQTKAKVSHLFDGIPTIIEGGPGTGKTTTLVQRLRFLIDPHLSEHETHLTEDQVRELTDPEKAKQQWIFLSPSKLLAQYLEKALSNEGLAHEGSNVMTYRRFLMAQLRNYFKPDGKATTAAFIGFIEKDELAALPCILQGEEAVAQFRAYLLDILKRPIKVALKTDLPKSETTVLETNIRKTCEDVDNYTSPRALQRLYMQLQNRYQQDAERYVIRLRELLKLHTAALLDNIMKDKDLQKRIQQLFDRWDNVPDAKTPETTQTTEEGEAQQSQEEEEPDNNPDKIDNDEASFQDIADFRDRLYFLLKGLLQRLALNTVTGQTGLGERQKPLYDEIASMIDLEAVQAISGPAAFQHYYASLCRGVEQNMFNLIAGAYRSFRRKMLRDRSPLYDVAVLRKVMTVKGRNGRMLHPDEEALLLGVINGMVREYAVLVKTNFARDDRSDKPDKSFEQNQYPYFRAYRENVRHVIGVDEASDFSALDYFCIFSFADPDFSAVTLCGDIMQGLGRNGIKEWKELEHWVVPKVDVMTLRNSYRQWPQLLKASKKMYRDDRGKLAPFKTNFEEHGYKPAPVALISEDEDKKIRWIADRIRETNEYFRLLPTTAVFIDDSVDAEEFTDRLQQELIADSLEVDDCTRGSIGDGDKVRVFRLSQVKGMEFECAFFHNIDATSGVNPTLLRRYLYVGISRARSHLGATFTAPGNPVQAYFSTSLKTWHPSQKSN